MVALHASKNGQTSNASHNKNGGIPVDYVSTRNNHHIAIYQTLEGKLEEISVTLWESVVRKKLGIPVIIKNPDSVWDFIQDKGIEQEDVLNNLPLNGWKFIESLQQNEMFVFRMSLDEVRASIERNNTNIISSNLYRVQNISEKYYVFRHHLETRLEKEQKEANLSIQLGKMIRIRSLDAFKKYSPIKVRISHLGKIQLE